MIVALEALASWTSFSVIPPTPRCTITSFTSSRSSLRSDSVHASSEPWTSAFKTMLSVAVSPRWICSKRSSNRAPLVAGERRFTETEDLHRRRRTGRLDLLALVVDERLDLAVGGAGDDGVADREQALLDHDRGDRAATDFEVGFEHGARG